MPGLQIGNMFGTKRTASGNAPASREVKGGELQTMQTSTGAPGTPGNANVSQVNNPRAPAATPLGLGEVSTYDMGTRNITLTQGVTTDQSLPLSMLGDTIQLDFEFSNTYTGWSGGTIDVTNSIDHIQLATAKGIIMASIPGNFLKLNYLRFSPQRNNAPSVAQAYASGVTTISGTISIPGLRLPKAYGPWQLTVFYTSIATASLPSGTGVTAVQVSNHIIGTFGNTGGKISRYMNQSFPLVSGSQMVQTNSVPQNVPIAELFLSGLASTSDITQIVLQTNGQVIEPNISGSLLVSRAAGRLVGTLPPGQLILLPSTQFTLNSSSMFQITDSQADSGNAFMWYWLE